MRHWRSPEERARDRLWAGVSLFAWWLVSLCVIGMIVCFFEGCAAFKPPSAAGPEVRIYSIMPAPAHSPPAPEDQSWQLRRYVAGEGPQILPWSSAKGFSCVSPADLELMLKAIVGVQ